MAKNPFTSLKDVVNQPKRNTFDLSFQNNLTMKFGRLYPVFCKEVIPGDSFRIKPTFGLRFMPLVFPVQTRMQANMHFFYVRNRNLWKDWPDFIGRTKKELVPPYLSPSVAERLCTTGGLGDYFGLPTTIAGSYGNNVVIGQDGFLPYGSDDTRYMYVSYESDANPVWSSVASLRTALSTMIAYTQLVVQGQARNGLAYGILSPVLTERELNDEIPLKVGLNFYPGTTTHMKNTLVHILAKDPSVENENASWKTVATVNYNSQGKSAVIAPEDPSGDVQGIVEFYPVGTNGRYYTSFDGQEYINDNSLNSCFRACAQLYGDLRIMVCFQSTSFSGIQMTPALPTSSDDYLGALNAVINYNASSGSDTILDVKDSTRNPYQLGDLKISALPFRAYEAIYNAFYRNQFNDPFKINGQVEYNKFITSDDGGEDSTPYDFFNRNWEMDFLTSAKQSPVDGDITPLVGVTGTGKFTFQNTDGTQYTVTPIVGDDGNTLTGIESVEGTPENNTGIRRLTDMISVGISINDFRNVNALQRWLETNLRRGYRYKDQLMSHFGVDAKFDVLDMPEFIGGVSEPVLVNQISQTTDQTGSSSGLGDFSKVLGSYAGQASVLASSNHDISKYCDEHGFIIGILSITPVPNYSQLLPKMFVKDNVLDYYFPEFGHIGNQPIPYREVCPLQSYSAGDSLNDVFGYQRAWYDYLASVDEVHGDFRTSLEGFLINRVFNVRPELGSDFIQVKEDEISNPFSVTDEGDKILGQVYFEVTAQRPIPKYGIPRLE